MVLPNFLIIGAAKCATTSLASLLEQHPEVIISKNKEPHFFSYNINYAKGLPYYEPNFAHWKGQAYVGDASTSYSRIRQHPEVLNRIKSHLKNPKIIYMVRNPIERIESAYIEQMTVPGNQKINSINKAVATLPMMIDSSRYWETYSAYAEKFGHANIKVVWFEEYIKDTACIFNEVCNFLGINDSFKPNYAAEKSNSRNYAKSRIKAKVEINRSWDSTLLKKIKKTLKNDNQKLLIHFGKPINFWKI